MSCYLLVDVDDLARDIFELISASANHIQSNCQSKGGWIKVGGFFLNHVPGLANATTNSVWQHKF